MHNSNLAMSNDRCSRPRTARVRSKQMYTKEMLLKTNDHYPEKMTALFPLQVHAAASMPDCPGINWLAAGDGIELVTSGTALSDTLEKLGLSSRLESFKRQLNYYGFETTKKNVEYRHPCLHRDKPALICYITRQTNHHKCCGHSATRAVRSTRNTVEMPFTEVLQKPPDEVWEQERKVDEFVELNWQVQQHNDFVTSILDALT